MYDDGSNVSVDRILVLPLFNLTFSCPVALSKPFSPLVQLGVSGRRPRRTTRHWIGGARSEPWDYLSLLQKNCGGTSICRPTEEYPLVIEGRVSEPIGNQFDGLLEKKLYKELATRFGNSIITCEINRRRKPTYWILRLLERHSMALVPTGQTRVKGFSQALSKALQKWFTFWPQRPHLTSAHLAS